MTDAQAAAPLKPRAPPPRGFRLFRAGDQVQATCGLETAPAQVLRVAEDGRALILAFGASFCGQVCTMPLVLGSAGCFRHARTERPVLLRLLGRAREPEGTGEAEGLRRHG